MDPEKRTLIRVCIDDAAQAERRVSTLMGDKVEPRRQWIEHHVQFTMVEEGSILDRVEDVDVVQEVVVESVIDKLEDHLVKEVSLFDDFEE